MEAIPEEKLWTEPLMMVDEKADHNHMLRFKLVDDANSNPRHSQKGTTSSLKTIANGLNALSGVGILSTPYAIASGGWLSLIFLFTIAILAFYSGLLIKRCMESDSNIRTYPDIGERAFGNKGRVLVSVLMYVELYLVATGFLILEGDNLHSLFPNFAIKILGLDVEGRQSFVIIAGLIILPTVWLDDLSILSYVSASGVLAGVVILGSVFWVGAFDGVGFNGRGKLLNWDGIGIAISLSAFCYCAHPMFPTLYTSMKKKHQFSNVLAICFILCTFSYASMAIIGYKMFGSDVKSQITLNLPARKLSSKIAIYTTLVNPIAKYALMVTPIVNATKTWFPSYSNKKSFNLVVSTSLLISSVIVALVFPFFGTLMSLVGAFLSVTASIILPCLCYLKISGNFRRFGCEVVILWGIIVFGIIVAIFGIYTSLLQIEARA
ncbi:amino acid transporter AVT1I-like [Mercurialis annua]|uniref:amino acid transporter AVT1I-like n=1 Tax=Mercurialis annua TaxID=3986 RepID=UPI00215EB5CF|nr:amino acid transporter AVT1I-like [Mercurialis annua]